MLKLTFSVTKQTQIRNLFMISVRDMFLPIKQLKGNNEHNDFSGSEEVIDTQNRWNHYNSRKK